MKKVILPLIAAVAALMISGCAKHEAEGAQEANQRYFNAWMSLNYPDLKPSGLGIYVIEDTPGTGAEVEKDGYALIDYVITDLEGNISSYTSEEVAKQLGAYAEGNYYGPKFQTTYEGALPAGLAEAFKGMKVGGSKKVIIPTWLMSYEEFDTEQEYLEESTSTPSAIYEFTVRDFTKDVTGWQISKIGDYFEANADTFSGMTIADSLSGHKGFYYKQLVAPTDTTSFKTDTTIYINYTGRLIDGTVFDTTNERLAKDSGLWSASRTYEPVSISWGEEYTDITMGSGGIITGFGLTLWQMREFEKGIGVFTSEYGYGYSGSGDNIPGFAPLVFEIEIVPKPEE